MRNIFHRSAEFVTEKIQRHKHHHHLFLAVLALAVAGTGAYTYRHEIAQAATYTFTQVSWIGGADTGATASHTSNQTGWDKYYSASTSITAGADVRLLSAGYSFVDDGTTGGDSPDASGGGFSSGTPSQAVVNGSGGSASVALAFVPAEYDVETGGSHTCAAKSDGTAYCWGYNNYGQLGNNTTTNISTPVQVLGVGGSGFLTGVSAISAGASHTCALKSDETVFCWGQNNVSGQLGDNTTTTSLTPVQVLGVGGSGFLTGVSAISAGASHTCAVKSDGTAYCWGEAANYQLGHYSFTDSYTPAQVHGVSNVGFLTGVSAISAGDNQTCAVKTDGTAYCWGLGTFGRLGDNTTTQRSTPVQVHGVSNVGFLAGVAKITTDAAFSCAAKSDGTAYCWGYNGYGQLGDNTTTQRNTPVQVHGVSDVGFLTDVSMIFSAGDTTTPSQTCALKTDGTAYCWGYNGFGQLGDNTTTQRNTPVQVHGVSDVGFLTGVGKIVTGYSYVVSEAGYTCAAKSDGTAYCWGNNGWGRLGDNTATHRSTPVQVHGVSDVGFLSLFTPTYYSSGTFTSATIDFARPTIFTTMSWTATLNGQTITMKARSSATSDFSGATAWGSCSNVTSGGNMSDGGCVTNGHQYLQYQATLSGDTVSTPTLDSVTINDTQYSANGGTLTSSKYDAGDDTNLISRLSWVGSATSSTEVIKFQVRSASSAAGLDTAVWCGPSITCDGTDYFLYTDNGVALATNHPLRSGANDRWVQYKVYLTSAGAITPLLTTVAVQYVVNAPPAVGNIQASQITDSGSADYGKVSFTFDASDSDTASGTVPYLVTPTLYEYYNGTSWTTISSGLSANAYSGITLTGNSATTTTAVTWTPTAGIALTSNAKVRVTISDGEAANATAIGTMAGTFTLDTTVPDITSAVIDSSVGASTAVGNTVGTITFSITDSSDKQYRFCNNSAFTSPDDQGNSCGWSTLAGTISGVATSTWVFTGNSADEAVYMQARDLYGNTTATRTIVAPAMPASFQFTDASNVSTGVYREFLSDILNIWFI
ncbi:MAG: Regulator of chromosome condensation RCC1 [Parcubacteria group bacterium GW2011_GWA1_44_13]|nr:MAG: Regulator of chromosome condensation RCC1 [Parcubacteria group bacterium GW2011_GWA1_44_13]